jgi:hypothetical protein
MQPQRYDNRPQLIKDLPDFAEALADLAVPTLGDHYVASAALVRGYLEIIRSHNSDTFPPELRTDSKRERRRYAGDYRKRLVDSYPEIHPETKVASLHFCCVQDPFSAARIVHFLAESTYLPSKGGGDHREWYSPSPYGLLTYTTGPVATHVMSGEIGHFVCTPLFSLAAFQEEVSRLQVLASSGLELPGPRPSYLFKLAIDSLSRDKKMQTVEPNSIGQLQVLSCWESDCCLQLETNDFRKFDVALRLCKTTWQVNATARQVRPEKW